MAYITVQCKISHNSYTNQCQSTALPHPRVWALVPNCELSKLGNDFNKVRIHLQRTSATSPKDQNTQPGNTMATVCTITHKFSTISKNPARKVEMTAKNFTTAFPLCDEIINESRGA